MDPRDHLMLVATVIRSLIEPDDQEHCRPGVMELPPYDWRGSNWSDACRRLGMPWKTVSG
jgi:hypothetical protein